MTEREQFEEWVKANWPDSVSLGMNIDGRYRYNHANALFGLWRQLNNKDLLLQLCDLELQHHKRYGFWFGWLIGVCSAICGSLAVIHL